jgi:protocatechuate 3,4-dioxygenase beta subunit
MSRFSALLLVAASAAGCTASAHPAPVAPAAAPAPAPDTAAAPAASAPIADPVAAPAAAPGNGLPGRYAHLNQRRHVAGRVTLGGRPVAARVILGGELVWFGLLPALERTADTEGRFDFGEQGAGYSTVTILHDGAAPLTWSYEEAPPGLEPTLALVPCARRIEGTIRDADGAPLAGALVGRENMAGGMATDAAGHYSICAASDWTTVSVRAPGHGGRARGVLATGVTQADFALAPQAILRGRVVDPGGGPIANALVRADGRGGPESATNVGAVSDADGRFELSGLGDGDLRLMVAAPGRIVPPATELHLTAGEVREEMIVTLRESMPVDGRVTVGGKPAAGLAVGWMHDQGVDWARTGDDGRFELHGSAPTTPHDVSTEQVFIPGHEVTTVGARERDDGGRGISLIISARPRPTLRGVVVHDGQPVLYARVSEIGEEGRNETWTDADGSFDLPFLAPGKHRVSIGSESLQALTLPFDVEVGENQVLDRGTIELDHESTAEGKVVDQQGKPVAGASVRVVNRTKTDFGWAVTGPDGSFAIYRLTGEAGPYEVTILPSPDHAIPFAPARGKTLPPIAVRNGKTHLKGLKLVVQRQP